MSVFCKGCRKTKVNEDFGFKTDGNQYKTCITCRYKKIKKIEEEEEITCCDVELIRGTFRKLNCRMVYLNELKYMMDLDRNGVRSIFNKMVMYNNIAIIETITSSNFCFILNLLTHLDIFNMEDIRTYGINLVIYKNSKDTMVRTISGYHMNIYHGFMECLKLQQENV